MLKVLSIDPGSRVLGYCCFDSYYQEDLNSISLLKNDKCNFFKKIGSMHISIVKFGSIKSSKFQNFNDRLKFICIEINKICKDFLPDEVIFESLIYVKNPLSLIMLSQIKGALLGIFFTLKINKIYEYSPTTIKKEITGYGHSDKKLIMQFISLNFNINIDSFKSEDESDAIAIGICHFLLKKN